MKQFSIGDHVEWSSPSSGSHVRGVVRGMTGNAYLHLELDPDMPEYHKKVARENACGYWFADITYCSLLSREPWQFPKTEKVKKGWEPDGFDPDAFREFMRTL